MRLMHHQTSRQLTSISESMFREIFESEIVPVYSEARP